MRLLLVEDDPTLGGSLRRDLAGAGYAVDVARDGTEAHDLGSVEPYDLIVLDLGLPKRQGLDVLKAWRAQGITTPVLILTARDSWHERVDGFKAGADDYLGKPFHFEELAARLSALGRRSHGHAPRALGADGWHVDEERQALVHADGTVDALTGIEFRMLRCFLLRPGKLLSKSWLMAHLYEGDHEVDSNVIEVYVNRLRRKLGAGWITTRRGQGYVFGPPAGE